MAPRAVVLLMLVGAEATTDGWLSVRDAQHPVRWPPLSAAQRAASAKLMAQIANGSFPLRADGLKRPAWLPPAVLAPRTGASVCTACFERAYAASLHARPFRPRLNEPVVLWDDAAIAEHECAARSAEPPQKTVLDALQRPAFKATNFVKHYFGMFGSALRTPAGGWRLWLGERQSFVADSANGINWTALTSLRASPTLPADSAGALFPNVCVTHDPHGAFPPLADPAAVGGGRLLLAHACGNARGGHSVCVATSALDDGVRWTPLVGATLTARDERVKPSQLPSSCGPFCALDGDSGNCVRWTPWAGKRGEYRLVKRKHWPLPPARWRGVRGVAIGAADAIDGPRALASFREIAAWRLDREGPLEHRARQVYALSVHELALLESAPVLAARGGARAMAAPLKRARSAHDMPPLQVGLASLLRWVDVDVDSAGIAGDVVTPFLITTRDGGVTADLSAIYAEQPLIPHGSTRPLHVARAAAAPERRSAPWLAGWPWRAGWRAPSESTSSASDNRRCFDCGYIQPASELLTSRDSHWLFYEGRSERHFNRFDTRATIALARWPLHRLVALRALPTCEAAQGPRGAARCARIVTRPFTLPSATLELNVDGTGSGVIPSARERGGLGGGGGGDGSSAVFVELLSAGARPDGSALDGFGAADALPVVANTLRAHVRWAGADSNPRLLALVGERRRVRLRISVCGAARLYSFTFVGRSSQHA
jgi:hypothetical protein